MHWLKPCSPTLPVSLVAGMVGVNDVRKIKNAPRLLLWGGEEKESKIQCNIQWLQPLNSTFTAWFLCEIHTWMPDVLHWHLKVPFPFPYAQHLGESVQRSIPVFFAFREKQHKQLKFEATRDKRCRFSPWLRYLSFMLIAHWILTPVMASQLVVKPYWVPWACCDGILDMDMMSWCVSLLILSVTRQTNTFRCVCVWITWCWWQGCCTNMTGVEKPCSS